MDSWTLDDETPVHYSPKFREHYFELPDGSNLTMRHCPGCGAQLPASWRDDWFDTLFNMGVDPANDDSIPPAMRSEEWWIAFPKERHPSEDADYQNYINEARKRTLTGDPGRQIEPTFPGAHHCNSMDSWISEEDIPIYCNFQSDRYHFAMPNGNFLTLNYCPGCGARLGER